MRRAQVFLMIVVWFQWGCSTEADISFLEESSISHQYYEDIRDILPSHKNHLTNYYKFENSYLDSSGNNKDLTGFNSPGFANSYLGKGIYFNNPTVRQYVTLALAASTQYSFSFWIYPTGQQNNGGRLYDSSGLLFLIRDTDKHISFEVSTNNGQAKYRTTTTPLTFHSWNHVVFTLDLTLPLPTSNFETRMKAYVNGIPQTLLGATMTIGSGATPYTFTPGSFGDRTSTTRWVKGTFDEYAIFNKILTSDQAEKIYVHQKTYHEQNP